MRSNHAIEEDGRRLPGIVPSATILIVNSTRYKINGAQAIAFTNITSHNARHQDMGRAQRLASPIAGDLWPRMMPSMANAEPPARGVQSR
jgi:hypothetical protein